MMTSNGFESRCLRDDPSSSCSPSRSGSDCSYNDGLQPTGSVASEAAGSGKCVADLTEVVKVCIS